MNFGKQVPKTASFSRTPNKHFNNIKDYGVTHLQSHSLNYVYNYTLHTTDNMSTKKVCTSSLNVY